MNYRNVITDEDVKALAERNLERQKEAQKALGQKWLLARTRLPHPANVTPMKKGAKK